MSTTFDVVLLSLTVVGLLMKGVIITRMVRDSNVYRSAVSAISKRLHHNSLPLITLPSSCQEANTAASSAPTDKQSVAV